MPPFVNLAGRRFGRLVVRERAYPVRLTRWACQCDCGGWSMVAPGQLLRPERPTQSCGCMVGLSEGQWQEILSAYNAGATLKEAAAVHGVTWSALHQQLKARGIQSRPRWDRPTVDETRFRDMTTEAEVYWLGMLYTDGCLSTHPHPRVTLSLAIRDREHVHKFARFLNARHEPHDYNSPSRKGCGVTQYSCQSAALVENLARQGMHDRKTWTITPWQGPEHLMRHFWRGCVDGDGCIRYTAAKNQWEVSFVGNETMCRGLLAFVRSHGHQEGGVYEDKRGYSNGERFYMAMWGGNRSAKAVAELLYAGATVGLDRKVELARQLTAFTPRNFDWSEVTRERIVELYGELRNWKAVATRLGVRVTTLQVYAAKRFGFRPRLDAAGN
jgi:hypothetical protein